MQQATAYQTTPKQNENILVFESFVRTKFPVLICLFGFSGCGKTLSAIKIAQGLGGKTMFLDTETGRGRVYADDAKGFGYAELTPPFTPERYMAAIKQIEAAGYDNLVLDSGSHEWDGLGGMLEIADANVTNDGKKKTGLGKWSVKSRHKKFMSTLLAGRMNVIICLRAKDKYVQEGFGPNAKITMSGFVPLQERNFKYDMMIQLPMPEDGEGRYLMDRAAGFKAPAALLPAFKVGDQITEEVGAKIAAWLDTGSSVDEVLRQLKADATEAAEFGSEAFRSFWKGIGQPQRDMLRPFLPNFESVAKGADDEAETAEAITDAINEESAIGRTQQPAPSCVDMSKLIPVNVEQEVKKPEETTVDITDWQLFLDEMKSSLSQCETVEAFECFFVENEKNISTMLKAPSNIKADWAKTVLKKRTGI